jgi:heptosyltransferase-3
VRILVVRRDNIGDLVCTTPLLAALRSRYPQAHIAALVNSYNAAVLDGNPDVDAVHVYTKLKHRLPGQSRLGILAARLRMLGQLRREAFDYVVLAKAGFDRQGLSLARQLRRREVVGFVDAGAAPSAITRPIPPIDYDAFHEVEVMARLGQALDAPDGLGPLRVHANKERVDAWRARIPELSDGRAWIALHISARQASRVWGADRWIELARNLAAIQGVGLVLLWSPGGSDDPRHPGDDAKAAAIQRALSITPARTETLADLIAVLSLCHAFIGPDGGAMHVAAGLGLPMVAVFENLESKKRRWHPWRVPYELVAPDVTIEQVMDAWQRVSRTYSAAPSALTNWL